MSYIYLLDQGEASLADTFSDIEPYVLSRLNRFLEKSYCKGKGTECSHGFPSGTTSRRSTEGLGEDLSISSPGVFLAKTFQLQEKELESRVKGADSGERWPGWFARYDLVSYSWRTPQCSLLGDYTEFSGPWPRWGTMRDGVCWELTMSRVPTKEREFGYWATPRANERGQYQRDGGQKGKERPTLTGQVKMWPTPAARDSKGANSAQHCLVTGTGRKHMDQLANAVVHGGQSIQRTFPTPGTTGMSNGTGNCGKANKLHELGVISEEERRSMRAGNGGQLNPDWVEWLMGWPIGWTVSKPLAMDRFRRWLRLHSRYCRRG